jgi:hypothetical protein
MAVEDDPGDLHVKHWDLKIHNPGSYMIKPTGNTAPPRILTRPGLDWFKAGEPPEIISDRRFPKDNITPATNWKRKAMRLVSPVSH